MTPPLPSTPTIAGANVSTDKDGEHLRLLSIFYYVHAGLQLAGMGFLFLHYLMLRTVFMRPEVWSNAKSAPPPPPEFVMTFFMAFYILGGVFLLAGIITNLMCGRFLQQRKRRVFCQFIAGFTCLSMPLGTILGIFTLLVLNRDSVRQKFDLIPAPVA